VATRTTIYLPDELTAALEPLKERINISRICASALHKEVERMQLVDRGLSDREALILRLRQQKREASEADEQAGRVQAAIDVRSLDYSELVKIAVLRLDLLEGATAYVQLLPEPVQVWLDKHEFELLNADPDGPTPINTEAWAFGWLSYVQEWWAEIKDEV
jgi:hypothetical protein